MKQHIQAFLLKDRQRFLAKGLFKHDDDALSMRIPGTEELLMVTAKSDEVITVSLDAAFTDEGGVHALIMRHRTDVGAILIGQTEWSEALSTFDEAMPTLFDEPARHIGPVAKPLSEADQQGLIRALQGITNIAIVGRRRICLGFTSERVVFNAELFEKCAKAYVIAKSTGQPFSKVPGWVCKIAGSRLKKDQQKSIDCYAKGEIPQGMNAY